MPNDEQCECCEATWMFLTTANRDGVRHRYCTDCIEAGCSPGHEHCVGAYSPMKDQLWDDPMGPDRADDER